MIPHDTQQPDVFTASDAYARRFDGPVGRWFLEVQAACVRALLPAESGLEILALGGGHGQLTPVLLEQGHRVCVQGSDACCARRIEPLLREHPTRLRFVACGLWDLPLADRSFDVCIAVRLLAHVEKWRELLAEMARVTRRQIIVDFPPRRGFNALTPLLAGVKDRLETATRPYFCYRTRELTGQFRRLGFSRIRTKAEFFWPMALHRVLRRRSLSVMLEAVPRAAGLTDRMGGPVLLGAERGPGEGS